MAIVTFMSKRASCETTETVDSMDRQPLYFAILILSILIGSSFYLSWAVDRGMGEVSVEKLSIDTASGRSIELLIYSPRTANHYEPMPLVLTIHGLTGTKEGMYAFNVELARRNFTVVSIDLPGHGDSTDEFDITDFERMALDAYIAVRHVQTTFPNVDNESYGVLTHSLGFMVAIELKDFPVAPMAYAAVGNVGKISQDEFVEFPENLLFALGSFDEIVSRQDALQAIRNATGIASAVAGVTYGSLDSQTAYRLTFGPSNHVFEVVDSTLVSETISWMVRGVQGESQILHTRDPTDQVYHNKNIATIASSFLLLISVIPVMWLVHSFLPEKLKPRRIPLDTQSYSIRRTFEISSVLGASAVIIFVAASLLGLNLEDIGISWLNSMSATGFILFLVVTVIGLVSVMFLFMGIDSTKKALASVGIDRSKMKDHASDILKNCIVAGVGITWLMVWLGLAGMPETMQPEILLALIKWPVGVRWVNTIILTILAVPLFLIDATWIRGLILSDREWSGGYQNTKHMLFTLISKFVIAGLLTVIVIFWTTAGGIYSGRIILLGVIWVRILIVQVLATVLISWTAIKFENTWSAVITSAFILALVVVTALPLI
jgi:pimeloyl-ACP methyl ester carboxylesterase